MFVVVFVLSCNEKKKIAQTTNPLPPIEITDEGKVLAIDNDEWAYTNSVENCERNNVDIEVVLGDVNQIKNNKFEPFNYEFGQRSQDLDPLFYENGLLYITKANLIFEDIIISKNAFPFQINHIGTPMSCFKMVTLKVNKGWVTAKRLRRLSSKLNTY